MAPVPRMASRGMISETFILSSSFEGLHFCNVVYRICGIRSVDVDVLGRVPRRDGVSGSDFIPVTRKTCFQYCSVRKVTKPASVCFSLGKPGSAKSDPFGNSMKSPSCRNTA